MAQVPAGQCFAQPGTAEQLLRWWRPSRLPSMDTGRSADARRWRRQRRTMAAERRAGKASEGRTTVRMASCSWIRLRQRAIPARPSPDRRPRRNAGTENRALIQNAKTRWADPSADQHQPARARPARSPAARQGPGLGPGPGGGPLRVAAGALAARPRAARLRSHRGSSAPALRSRARNRRPQVSSANGPPTSTAASARECGLEGAALAALQLQPQRGDDEIETRSQCRSSQPQAATSGGTRWCTWERRSASPPGRMLVRARTPQATGMTSAASSPTTTVGRCPSRE